MLYRRSHDLPGARRRLRRILDRCARSHVPELLCLARVGRLGAPSCSPRSPRPASGVSNAPTEAVTRLLVSHPPIAEHLLVRCLAHYVSSPSRSRSSASRSRTYTDDLTRPGRLLAVNATRFPADFGHLARYGQALDRLRPRLPLSDEPLSLRQLEALAPGLLLDRTVRDNGQLSPYAFTWTNNDHRSTALTSSSTPSSRRAR